MKSFFFATLIFAAGLGTSEFIHRTIPQATWNYFEGWQAGREFCKATDETPINQQRRPIALLINAETTPKGKRK